jgi:hypothetical protein
VREYAVLQGGDVVSIFLTSRVMDDAAKAIYRGEVVPVDQVPLAKLEAYRYWGERP